MFEKVKTLIKFLDISKNMKLAQFWQLFKIAREISSTYRQFQPSPHFSRSSQLHTDIEKGCSWTSRDLSILWRLATGRSIRQNSCLSKQPGVVGRAAWFEWRQHWVSPISLLNKFPTMAQLQCLLKQKPMRIFGVFIQNCICLYFLIENLHVAKILQC